MKSTKQILQELEDLDSNATSAPWRHDLNRNYLYYDYAGSMKVMDKYNNIIFASRSRTVLPRLVKALEFIISEMPEGNPISDAVQFHVERILNGEEL